MTGEHLTSLIVRVRDFLAEIVQLHQLQSDSARGGGWMLGMTLTAELDHRDVVVRHWMIGVGMVEQGIIDPTSIVLAATKDAAGYKRVPTYVLTVAGPCDPSRPTTRRCTLNV